MKILSDGYLGVESNAGTRLKIHENRGNICVYLDIKPTILAVSKMQFGVTIFQFDTENDRDEWIEDAMHMQYWDKLIKLEDVT